ncbi:MAG TPA: hypothetical protein VG826_26180 [Pirellulales bacterium]|nr:hypothetical protein [Pirellulales bacterium]
MQHDFDDIVDRLDELRAKAEAMLRDQEEFVHQLIKAQEEIDQIRRQGETAEDGKPPSERS